MLYLYTMKRVPDLLLHTIWMFDEHNDFFLHFYFLAYKKSRLM